MLLDCEFSDKVSEFNNEPARLAATPLDTIISITFYLQQLLICITSIKIKPETSWLLEADDATESPTPLVSFESFRL